MTTFILHMSLIKYIVLTLNIAGFELTVYLPYGLVVEPGNLQSICPMGLWLSPVIGTVLVSLDFLRSTGSR